MDDHSRIVRAFLDRIESGTAVLEQLDGKMTFDFPVFLLPDSVVEGSVIEITVKDRPDLADQRRRELRELQYDLIEKPDDSNG